MLKPYEVIADRHENVEKYGFSIDTLESYDLKTDRNSVRITLCTKKGQYAVVYEIPPKVDMAMLAKALRSFAYQITHPKKEKV
jgi:hypothetical protein